MKTSKLLYRRSEKAGLSPGTLVHVGDRKEERVTITRFDYGPEQIREAVPATVEECLTGNVGLPVSWINVDGLHEISIIEKLGQYYHIDPLSLEDILTMAQRPKIEDYGAYLLIIVKMLSFESGPDRVKTEQVSLVLGTNYVISFQESKGDVFGPLRGRLRKGKGRIRKMGADYLAYALLDSIVDNYFILLEKLGERVEALEEDLSRNPRQETLQAIHELRRENIFLRKSVWPLREVIGELARGESGLIRDDLDRYLRDLYEHTIQIIDIIEMFQDLLSGMLDLYLSSVSNRMNEIMKVLTVFASIFIPLTFIAGVYGMNFEYMPELSWHWAYPVLWLLMIGGAVGMLFMFRRKGWL